MTAGQPDLVAITRRLLALRRALAQLERHRGHPLQALSDLDEQWVVLHGLQICAQTALDVATHIAASAGLDAPDYATAIDRLADIGVLERPFAGRFRDVAGFRDVVVHDYLDVDLAVVHDALNHRLDDFRSFMDAIEAWTKRVR